MKPWKKLLCMGMVVCALSMSCMAGAAEAAVEDAPALVKAGNSGSEITPMVTRYVLRNVAITSSGRTWRQANSDKAYAITVNNTTNQQMRVTVTGGSPTTFYVPANSSRSVTKNNAVSGSYTVSFSTSSGALSGTFSVMASDDSIM